MCWVWAVLTWLRTGVGGGDPAFPLWTWSEGDTAGRRAQSALDACPARDYSHPCGDLDLQVQTGSQARETIPNDILMLVFGTAENETLYSRILTFLFS